MTTTARSLGLVAGNGQLPLLIARAARSQGIAVHTVAHRGEAEESLGAESDSIHWVQFGQLGQMVRHFKKHQVEQVVLVGGISRARLFTGFRPDLTFLKLLSTVRSTRDDEALRRVAAFFEQQGLPVGSATELVPEVMVQPGLLAGAPLTEQQRTDVAIGREVAAAMGRVDVGQTVVVKRGSILAVEAIEGTDEAIRRAGRLGGAGAVVVKRSKPGQDTRFDLPAVGPMTLEVMREAGAAVLAIEAGRSVMLQSSVLLDWAPRLGISVLGYSAE